jgi:hypothetical protein
MDTESDGLMQNQRQCQLNSSSEAHPASYPMGTRGKAWLRHDTDHSPPFSVELRND